MDFYCSERLTPAQCLRHDWIRKPLQPSTRARHRKSESEEEESDEESSEDEDDEDIFKSILLKKDPPKPVKDEVFRPARVEPDEGKKRKISEDVLEKEKAKTDKKRRDDNNSSSIDTSITSKQIDEKMSTSSLLSEAMSIQKSDTFSEITEEKDVIKDTSEPVSAIDEAIDNELLYSEKAQKEVSKENSSSMNKNLSENKNDEKFNTNQINSMQKDKLSHEEPKSILQQIEQDFKSKEINIPIKIEGDAEQVFENQSLITEHSKSDQPSTIKTEKRVPLVYVTTKAPPSANLATNSEHENLPTSAQTDTPTAVSISGETQKPSLTLEKFSENKSPEEYNNESSISQETERPVDKTKSEGGPTENTVRSRKIPLEVIKQEISKPADTNREIPITVVPKPVDMSKDMKADDRTQIKPQPRGRVIPITLETEDPPPAQPPPNIRKRDQTPSAKQPQIRTRQRATDAQQSKSNRNSGIHEKSGDYDQKTDKIRGSEINTIIKTPSKTSQNQRRREDDSKTNVKRDLSSDEKELERTKRQLNEFVQRWNSTNDSSYVKGIPIQNLALKDEKTVLAFNTKDPKIQNYNDVFMKDINEKLKKSLNSIEEPKKMSQEEMAKELEQKLNELKELEKSCLEIEKMCEQASLGSKPENERRTRNTDGSLKTKDGNFGLNRHDSMKRKQNSKASKEEPRARRRPPPPIETDDSKMGRYRPSRDVPMTSPMSPTEITKKVERISISDKRDESPARRSRTSGRHKPTRDVPSKSPLEGIISIPISYESLFPPGKEGKEERKSPARHSRKSSKERVSRTSSKDSIASTGSKTYRRPSRDAALTSSQTERLGALNVSGCEVIEANDQNLLWPDIRVVPQDDTVEIETEEGETTPPMAVTYKLEVPVQTTDKTHQTNHKPESNRLNNSSSIPSQSLNGNRLSDNSCSVTDISYQENYSRTESNKYNKSQEKGVNDFARSSTSTNNFNSNSTSTKSTVTETIPSPNSLDTTYVPENKLVAWILDLGVPQTRRLPCSGSTTDLVNHFEGGIPGGKDRDKSPRRRDKSPVPPEKNRDRIIVPPKPPFGCPLTREPSVTGLNSNETNEIIQTPWGTLKRSPSRTSIAKSPSKNSLNVSPTSTTLLQNPSTEKSAGRYNDTINKDENSNGRINKSFAASDSTNRETESRSPSPHGFKPYNTNSYAAKGLPDINSRSTNTLRPSHSSSVLHKEGEKNEQISPGESIHSSHLGINDRNSHSITKIDSSSHERIQQSSFDRKVNKQTSLEVLNDIDKRDNTAIPSNKSLSESKFNSLPRQRSPKEFSSFKNLNSSSKPPCGENKRHSADVTTAESAQKRSSKVLPGAPLPPKKQFSFLLFSAHDRISQFEKKDDVKPSNRTQRPISRSKTTTHFNNDTSSNSKLSPPLQTSPSMSNKPVHRDEKQKSVRPSVVSSKFEDSFAESLSKSRLTEQPFPDVCPSTNSVDIADVGLNSANYPLKNMTRPPQGPGRSSKHVGFLKDRLLEKQNPIKSVVPFSANTNISKITSDKYISERSNLRKRIRSVDSLL